MFIKNFCLVALSLLVARRVIAAANFEGERAGEGEGEPYTGIFDTVDGPITNDTITKIVPNNVRKLVYGMKARPSADIIKEVLDQGLVDVNAFDGYGSCSLYYALCNGDYSAADTLIACGADVNAFSFSTTLVHVVQSEALSEEDKLVAVKYLMDHGADPKATGKSGFYALTATASRGHMNLIQFFLDLGLQINHRDNYGCTPLMEAVSTWRSRIDTVKLLLANGADMRIKDNQSENALFHAASRCNYEILEYLLQNGGAALLTEVNGEGKTVGNIFNGCAYYEREHERINEIVSRYN